MSDNFLDFCGTIVETVESSEMRRRAAERVRSLQPELKVCDVRIEVRQQKDSTLFDIDAVGSEPLYTHVLLDALLNEFMAFRGQIREQQQSKALVTLAEDVVRREMHLADKREKLTNFEKANNIRLINGELNRLTPLVLRLRGERDEAKTSTRSSSTTEENGNRLACIERELAEMEKEIERLNSTTTIHDGLSKDYQESKRGYDEILALVGRFKPGEESRAYSVRILERASASVLDFQQWLRATILGLSAGLILSLYFAEVLYIAGQRSADSPASRDTELPSA